jgi:hypothetical protein
MIKRREPSSLADIKQIDAFAAKADGGESDGASNPNAKRTFKAISVTLNEYEYLKLKVVADQLGSTKLYAIRQAIIKVADEIEGSQ